MLKIQAERLRRNWSQLDLGYRAKVQPSEISRIETGQAVPYPKQRARLAKVLKVPPEELLDTVEPEAAAS